jgi:hypothetical protein
MKFSTRYLALLGGAALAGAGWALMKAALRVTSDWWALLWIAGFGALVLGILIAWVARKES